jgi:hypothetical protein
MRARRFKYGLRPPTLAAFLRQSAAASSSSSVELRAAFWQSEAVSSSVDELDATRDMRVTVTVTLAREASHRPRTEK